MAKGPDIRELRATAEREPDSLNAHLRLGTALAQRNQLPEAEKAILRALEIDPKCAGAYVNLGGIKLTALDFNGCVEANDKAIECDPNLTLAHFNRGLAYLYLNQPNEMLPCFERVVELEPGNAAGVYHLAVALHAVGRTPEAHARLAEATDMGHSPDPRFIKAVQAAIQRIEGGANAAPTTDPKAKN
jgi:tetratricopeptide (TPR) repeat protein